MLCGPPGDPRMLFDSFEIVGRPQAKAMPVILCELGILRTIIWKHSNKRPRPHGERNASTTLAEIKICT